MAKQMDVSNPFSTDPERHPAIIVNQQRPFNAETPPALIMDHIRTRNDPFFVRNHMPVPKVDVKAHRLTIEGLGINRPLKLPVDQMKKNCRPASVTCVVQCAGNRRADMNEYKKTQGMLWKGTAISGAEWTGVRLRNLLLFYWLVLIQMIKESSTGQSYGASITFEKAMSSEIIIAYSMNEKDIPPHHGVLLRCMVPGVVGARQVKWLKTIRLSEVESPRHWPQNDYRAFSPRVDFGDKLDWKSVPAIQEYPIQSAFCIPALGTKVERAEKTIDVAGYAWSGDGRGIIQVEVSADGCKTWQSAELKQDPQQDLGISNKHLHT